MAKLIAPQMVYRDIKYGDGKWHISFLFGGSSLMLCGTQIYHQFCEERDVAEVDADNLCSICTSPLAIKENK